VRITARGFAATAASALLLALAAGPAAAKFVDGYCSTTGDYCTSVVDRSGQTFLGISTFSFTGRYRLCTRIEEDGERECKRFRLHKDGDTYRSFVKFTKHFSHEGTGNYCASWHKFATRLGPQVCFVFTGP
jgi:hypothetical protein